MSVSIARGCIPSNIDLRDYRLSAAGAEALPEKYACANLPKVKNQGSVSSCVAHAVSSILEFFDGIDGSAHNLSTNFIYGAEKAVCGREGKGMLLRNACKIVKELGTPPEVLCKGNDEVPKAYEIAEAALADSEICGRAWYFHIDSYYDCKTEDAIKKAIYKYGPVLACVKWYDDFKVKNGMLASSLKGDYGWHAVMLYGWDEDGYLMQNSWGSSWGNKGRAIIPYDFPITEVKALLDSTMDIDESDFIIPKRNKFLDFIYTIINWILNLFKKY